MPWQRSARRISRSWLNSCRSSPSREATRPACPGGLLNQLTRTVLEPALEAEATSMWDYAKHGPAGRRSSPVDTKAATLDFRDPASSRGRTATARDPARGADSINGLSPALCALEAPTAAAGTRAFHGSGIEFEVLGSWAGDSRTPQALGASDGADDVILLQACWTGSEMDT